MKNKEDIEIYNLLKQEDINQHIENRDELRIKAKQQILKIQDENARNNKKRKISQKYKVGDVVAIRRTQFGVGLKVKPKYFGPYEVKEVKGKDLYEVEKLDSLKEGPKKTSSAADYMKLWPADDASSS